MLNHAKTVPQSKAVVMPCFYRCNSCGKWIPQRRINKAYKGGILCKCGGKYLRKANSPLWWEIMILILHPSLLKKTILNPFNWGNWRKYFV